MGSGAHLNFNQHIQRTSNSKGLNAEGAEGVVVAFAFFSAPLCVKVFAGTGFRCQR